MNIKLKIKLQRLLLLLINSVAANDALKRIGEFYTDATSNYISFTKLLAQLMLHHR